MKRNYSITKALYYFVEQKFRETWGLWYYTVILGCVEYVCWDVKEPFFMRVVASPLIAFAIACVTLGIYLKMLDVKNNFHYWVLSFKSWILRNWIDAKARAKYE